MKTDQEILEEIFSVFVGKRKQPPRRKLNRCLGCGKVTRHVFCPRTLTECRGLYQQREEKK